MGDLLEFILVFVPIAMVAGLVFYLIRNRKSRPGSDVDPRTQGAGGTSGEQVMHSEKMQLEERVRVLERIVTDRSHSLEQEIEALRDKPTGSGVPLDVARKETQ